MPPFPTGPWYFDADWGTFWQIFGAIGALALSAMALVVAVLIAWRQFRIMDDQGKVIEDQLELLRGHGKLLTRIEGIEDEQRLVLKRQGEIAERQREIMEEQLAKKAVLEVRYLFHRVYAEVAAPAQKRVQLQLGIYNSGTRSPHEGLYWKVLIPKQLGDASSLVWDELETKQGEAEDEYKEPCYCYENVLKDPVFPKRTTIIGTLDIPWLVLEAPYMITWSIIAEDGAFPSDDRDGELPITKQAVEAVWLKAHPRGTMLQKFQ
jgi:hypothetical protein